MRITRLIIINKTLDEFINFIIQHLEFNYENHSSKMTVLIHETSISKDYETQILIAKDLNTTIQVDLISNPFDYAKIDFKIQEPKLSKKVIHALETYGKNEGIKYEVQSEH